MKRFVVLIILVAFVTVGCGGPNKVRWTKPDFRQDEFDKDREDCIQAVKGDLEQRLTVEECLVKKGYESEPETSTDKEKSKTAETGKTVGKVLLITALFAVGVAVLVTGAAAIVAIGALSAL